MPQGFDACKVHAGKNAQGGIRSGGTYRARKAECRDPLEDHNKSIQQTRTHARARWARGGISVRDHGSSTLVR